MCSASDCTSSLYAVSSHPEMRPPTVCKLYDRLDGWMESNLMYSVCTGVLLNMQPWGFLSLTCCGLFERKSLIQAQVEGELF